MSNQDELIRQIAELRKANTELQKQVETKVNIIKDLEHKVAQFRNQYNSAVEDQGRFNREREEQFNSKIRKLEESLETIDELQSWKQQQLLLMAPIFEWGQDPANGLRVGESITDQLLVRVNKYQALAKEVADKDALLKKAIALVNDLHEEYYVEGDELDLRVKLFKTKVNHPQGGGE